MEWKRTIEANKREARQVKLAFLGVSVVILLYGLIVTGVKIQDFTGFWENIPLLFFYLYTPYLFLGIGVAIGGFFVENWLNLKSIKWHVVFILSLPFLYSAVRFPIEIVLFGFPTYEEFMCCSLLTIVFLIWYAFLLTYNGKI